MNIYDDALANWHALNERMKNSDLSGIEPGPLVCRMKIIPLSHTGSQRLPGKSKLVKSYYSPMVSQATNCI